MLLMQRVVSSMNHRQALELSGSDACLFSFTVLGDSEDPGAVVAPVFLTPG